MHVQRYRLRLIKTCFFIFLPIVTFTSCTKEMAQTETLEPSVTGFLRTLELTNSDLELNDSEGFFSIDLEANDSQNGDLLENVDVFVAFKSNNGINEAGQEVWLKSLDKEEFSQGNGGFPQVSLRISYSEFVVTTNAGDIQCGDQFLVRLQLNLTNGSSFSTSNSNSPAVIGMDTTINSPFCYTVNIVEAMLPETFTGLYRYESIVDGPLGPTFGSPKIVELKKGNSINERYFEGDYIASRSNEPSRKFRFVFTCEKVLFRKNQISSFFTWCPEGDLSGGITFGGPPILLGPAREAGTISMDDDSFFELSIMEGYQGWDGDCGFGSVPAKIRFTKVE